MYLCSNTLLVVVAECGLQDGEYFKLEPDTDNIIKSQAFPGLRLAIAPLLEDNLAQVLQTVQQGLGTIEHQNFVKKIN